MVDKLIAETWIYQKMLREADEGKREEGRVEGLAEGQIKEARQTITAFVEKRAPALLAWVKAKIERINDLQTLQQIRDALFVAKSMKEMKAAFPA